MIDMLTANNGMVNQINVSLWKDIVFEMAQSAVGLLAVMKGKNRRKKLEGPEEEDEEKEKWME